MKRIVYKNTVIDNKILKNFDALVNGLRMQVFINEAELTATIYLTGYQLEKTISLTAHSKSTLYRKIKKILIDGGLVLNQEKRVLRKQVANYADTMKAVSLNARGYRITGEFHQAASDIVKLSPKSLLSAFGDDEE